MSPMYVIDQSGTVLDVSSCYLVDGEALPEDASDSENYEVAVQKGIPLNKLLQDLYLYGVEKEWVTQQIDEKIASHEVRVGWISGIIGLLFVFGIIHSIWLVKQLALA